MAAINRYYNSNKFSSRTQFLSLGIKCVFISHQKNDKNEARKVADYLQNAGIEIYFDEYDNDLRIQHQNNDPKAVTESICKGINNSSHMLVIISPNTLYSNWVPFEIGFGYDKTELGILCLKDIPKGKLPEYIRTARIIRDIYDLNNLIVELLRKDKEILMESKFIREHNSDSNPLASVMDSIIYDYY